MPHTPKLTWYFDPISPFAYLALPEVERLARTHVIEWRPIVFGAVLANWGQLGPAEIAPKRVHTYQLCQFLADRAGIPLRFPPRHPFRSLETLRLLAASDTIDLATIRTVFDFIWVEGHDPSDPADHEALATRLGTPAMASDEAKARLRAWTEDAIAAGVFGVPTLAIGSTLFWGLDAMPMAEATLADPGLLDRGEMARLSALPVGVARKAK